MSKDKALKLAIAALKLNNREWKALADSGDSGQWSAEEQDHYQQTEQAIIAAEEALAQPERVASQEPVAWIYSQGAAKVVSMNYVAGVRATPLYTTPPQRTWVGLDDDEIIGMTCDCVDDGSFDIDCAIDFGRQIERALKKRNSND